jgi:hypothetical protein
MDRKHSLEEVVRAWVEVELPGQAAAANRAVELLSGAYESGHSVLAACRQVSEFINCRVQHPAYQRGDSHAVALLAS